MPWCLKSQVFGLFAQLFVQDAPKKTSELCITGLCEGNSPVTHKGPVMLKMFLFDDVIMGSHIST